MNKPFTLLDTGQIQNIISIPKALNKDNVNELNNSKLNIFETLCSLIPNQQDQNAKNALENTAAQILEQMISITETKWDKKDANGNTIFEWGIWSGSSKIMNVFHTNQQITGKFIQIEKAQIHNFFRVAMEPHISDDFRKTQIEKLKPLGLDINELGQDGHTALYNAITTYLNTYLSKYTNIINKQPDQVINAHQLQIDKYHQIIENLVKFDANPSLEAESILNLLVPGSLQIQANISKISDAGHKFLATANFKTLTENVHKLVEKTLENYDLSTSNIGNNVIAVLGNEIWSIKQNILKTTDQAQKTSLTNSFKELKSLAEPIIEKIVKQQGFKADIKDKTGFSSVSWLAEFGPKFLKQSIEEMQKKPDVNLKDNGGMSALHWYSDYNAAQVVEILAKNGGDVNSRCDQNAATPAHFLFLNTTTINANKEKLSTLKALLNKENKPPFDPNIKMVGDKTAADVLEEKKAAIVDYDACHTSLDGYTTWYNNDYSVASLGQAVEEFNLYE